MAQNSANHLHWKAYLLGFFTGIPKLIHGVRNDDRTEAFHGAQATAWGILFVVGVLLLDFGLRMALPAMGITGSLSSLYIAVAVWICYYLWFGTALWFYLACIVTALGGGWNVSGFLTWCTLRVENVAAFILRK